MEVYPESRLHLFLGLASGGVSNSLFGGVAELRR